MRLSHINFISHLTLKLTRISNYLHEDVFEFLTLRAEAFMNYLVK